MCNKITSDTTFTLPLLRKFKEDCLKSAKDVYNTLSLYSMKDDLSENRTTLYRGGGVQLRALQQKFSGSDSYFVANCIVVNDHKVSC